MLETQNTKILKKKMNSFNSNNDGRQDYPFYVAPFKY